MQHFPQIQQDDVSDADEMRQTEFKAPDMQDRSEQGLTNVIGGLFSIGSFLCMVALAGLSLFFVKIIARGGEIGMLPIFAALGVSFVLGALLLDFTHAKALAGYRAAREQNARRSRAIAGAVLCLVLGMIHPLMALAVPVSAGLGCLGHYVLNRFFQSEPAWDFLPKEAISILTGRDKIGLQLTTTRAPIHVMAAPITRAGIGLSLLVSVASGSYLIAQNIMTMSAFIPLVIGSLWAAHEILDYAEARFSKQDTDIAPAAWVEKTEVDRKEENLGLSIQNLNVRRPGSGLLLSDINLDVEPGQVTGVIGDSGSGKSLLFQSIVDPFSLSGLEVSGNVRVGRNDLWQRQSTNQYVPAIFLPPEPLVLPASGNDNLTCFHPDDMLLRGKWFLEQLVFSVDMVEDICEAPDARHLPTMQRKSLALARAFTLGPPLYLLDQPEDGLPEKQIGSLVYRLKQEARMGRSILLSTHNRAMLEACDRLIVMQQGRIIDYGDATEVRSRIDSGWSRFKSQRTFETEQVLITWVRSHFFRNGDEANRRKVAAIAADMLAFSCQSADSRNPGHVEFTFKHFQGHCMLRMLDGDPPVGNGSIRKAEIEAQSEQAANKLSLLGSIMRSALEVEFGSRQDDRMITAKIETYDPRKTGARDHASQP